MQKHIIVKQTGFKDCAVSCLLSIIRYYNGNISKEELSDLINTNENGSSAYHMIEGMKKIGFEGFGFRKTSLEIFENNITCPFIAHVKNNNYYHFVVVYKIDNKRKYLILMDPACGKRKISFEEFNNIYLESVLEFYVRSELPNIKDKDTLFSLVYKYISLNRKDLIKLFIFGIVGITLTLISSFYYKIVIDNYISNENVSLLMIIFVTFLNIIVFKNIVLYVKNKILINLKSKINENIMINVLKHVLSLPYRYFKNRPTGEVMSRINNVNDVNEFISNIFMTLLVNSILILISLIFLIFINIKLFLITFFIILIYLVIVFLYSKILKRKVYDLKEVGDSYNKILTETFENYETIKNLGLVSKFINNLNICYIKFLRMLKKCESLILKENSIKDSVLEILNLITICFGGYLVINKIISLGDLVLYVTILSFFIEPIKEILNLILNYNYSVSSYERLNDIVLIKEENLNYSINNTIKGDIVIDNLGYSFDKINKLFDNRSIYIKYGSMYLIHGPSGSGKSTLVKVLLKYYEEYDGNVCIDEMNLKDIKTEIIRNSFTYVSQNENLFSLSLKENIILGRNVKEEEYEKVLKICKVDEIRNRKMFRDNYLIEDKGFNLSGGEKQKIILARALLKKCNYLILDECLSEVDISTEKEIINNIKEYYHDKTIIYITHKEEIKCMFKEKYEC